MCNGESESDNHALDVQQPNTEGTLIWTKGLMPVDHLLISCLRPIKTCILLKDRFIGCCAQLSACGGKCTIPTNTAFQVLWAPICTLLINRCKVLCSLGSYFGIKLRPSEHPQPNFFVPMAKHFCRHTIILSVKVRSICKYSVSHISDVAMPSKSILYSVELNRVVQEPHHRLYYQLAYWNVSGWPFLYEATKKNPWKFLHQQD